MAPRILPSDTPTPTGTREDRREFRELSRLPLDPAGAVADLVERVCHAAGGAKALAGGAIHEGYAQVRRWAGDGDIPSLRQILRLVELAGPDDPFRPALVAHLTHMFDPTPPDPERVAEAVAERLHGKRVSAETAAQTVRDVLVEFAPGRWVRR